METRTLPTMPSETQPEKQTAETKHKQVLDMLQHDIVFGRLKPRERLVEEELSERFAVGRYVIRAALEELDRMGLVRRRAHRGVIVSDYAPQEVEELYDIRCILQREAAQRITLPASAAFLAQIEAINADYVNFGLAGDLNQAANANDQFHQLIFNACNNRHLADLIQHYWLKTAAIHCYAIATPALAETSRQEHFGIINAMRVGNRDEFVRLCVEHMLPALTAFKSAHGGWPRRSEWGRSE